MHGAPMHGAPMHGAPTPESVREAARAATRDAIRVVKIGGRAQADPRLAQALAAAARQSPLVVVHGGGDELTALQRRLGIEPVFVGGRRVTTDEDLELVRMVLSGSANKRLVAALASAGARAAGVSGEDGPTLHARAADRERMGAVGTVTRVDPSLVRHLAAGGWLPVVSPLARDEQTGGALNVNGDDAAAALAAAIGAAELLLVADVAGVLDGGAVVTALQPERATALVASGAASGGMVAKLEAARHALAGGVARVRIAGVEGILSLAAGTTIHPSPTGLPHPGV